MACSAIWRPYRNLALSPFWRRAWPAYCGSGGAEAAHRVLHHGQRRTCRQPLALDGKIPAIAAVLKAGSGGPSTFPSFPPCPWRGLGSACRDRTCLRDRIISHSGTDPRPKRGGYDLNLIRVTFPAPMPSNPPHHRSGAALYYIISGTGANTVDGKTVAGGPGSLIFEPYGLVHQWGNPGNEPLTFLAFNINVEGAAAVLPGAPVKSQ